MTDDGCQVMAKAHLDAYIRVLNDGFKYTGFFLLMIKWIFFMKTALVFPNH
jgi:transposase